MAQPDRTNSSVGTAVALFLFALFFVCIAPGLLSVGLLILCVIYFLLFPVAAVTGRDRDHNAEEMAILALRPRDPSESAIAEHVLSVDLPSVDPSKLAAVLKPYAPMMFLLSNDGKTAVFAFRNAKELGWMKAILSKKLRGIRIATGGTTPQESSDKNSS